MYRCLDTLDEFYRSIFEKECIMFKCPDSSGLILYYGNLYTFLLISFIKYQSAILSLSLFLSSSLSLPSFSALFGIK